jgi:hypothetical protein
VSPNDRKHKAARLAARIFATVLFPSNRWEWQTARDKAEKLLLEAAEQLLDAYENSPAKKRREKKEKLQELREHLQKNKKKT